MAMAEAVTSVDLKVEDHEMGRLMGRGGANIKKVMATTATKMEVLTGAGGESKTVFRVTGTQEAVAKAKKMMESVGIGGARREVMVREDQVGIIIGKGGGTLKKLEEETGARLVVQGRRPGFSERSVQIYGTKRQAAAAARRVNKFLEERKDKVKDKVKDEVKDKVEDNDKVKDNVKVRVKDKSINTLKDKSDKDKELASQGQGARLEKRTEFSDRWNGYIEMMERLDLLTD